MKLLKTVKCSSPHKDKVRAGVAKVSVNTNGHSLAIDDVVLLAIDESVVWFGMLQLYVWPLMALIIGGILGQSLSGEIGAMIGAFGCLILSLLSVRWRTQREHDNYLPIVIKKLI